MCMTVFLFPYKPLFPLGIQILPQNPPLKQIRPIICNSPLKVQIHYIMCLIHRHFALLSEKELLCINMVSDCGQSYRILTRTVVSPALIQFP